MISGTIECAEFTKMLFGGLDVGASSHFLGWEYAEMDMPPSGSYSRNERILFPIRMFLHSAANSIPNILKRRSLAQIFYFVICWISISMVDFHPIPDVAPMKHCKGDAVSLVSPPANMNTAISAVLVSSNEISGAALLPSIPAKNPLNGVIGEFFIKNR
jgi:hypothetical protein